MNNVLGLFETALENSIGGNNSPFEGQFIYWRISKLTGVIPRAQVQLNSQEDFAIENEK